MVLASLKEIIELNSLVAAFRRSTLVVHQPPLVTFPWWRSIKPDVGLQGDGTGSAILGIRAGMLTGTEAIVIQRTAELGVLTAQIIAIGFHLEAGGANGNAIRTNHDAMVVLSLLGITKVEGDEGND